MVKICELHNLRVSIIQASGCVFGKQLNTKIYIQNSRNIHNKACWSMLYACCSSFTCTVTHLLLWSTIIYVGGEGGGRSWIPERFVKDIYRNVSLLY